MEKKFSRDIKSLDKIFEFVWGFLARNKIDEATGYSVNLAIEEIFTNMVKYNAGSLNDISISLSRDKDRLIMRLTDHDVDSFDVTKSGEVDIGQPLHKRKAGGLGLHLVKKVMDRIEYNYEKRTSTVTMTKILEN